MSKCILCFHPVAKDVVFLVCPNEACGMAGVRDDVASDWYGREVKAQHSVAEHRPSNAPNAKPTTQFCTHCGTKMIPPKDRWCLRCHAALPEIVFNSDVTAVAFAGPRSSGKTVAMKVGLSPLYELLVAAGGALTLMPELSTVQVRDEDLKSQILPATDRRLPWTLVFSMGVMGGRHRILAIRDIAGEDLADAHPPGRFEYFEHADLVVFLFDPFEVPEVRNALDDILPPAPTIGVNPGIIFGNMMGHVGKGSPNLAVVVSKFDVLHELSGVEAAVAAPFQNPGAGYMRSRQEEFRYDERTGALISEEVRSLLIALNAGALVNLAENPVTGRSLKTRFFAMSALGAAADGTDLHAHGKSPYRVLDPLFWILSERGLVERLER